MSSSPIAVWSDQYSLDLEEIDNQHKTLFELVNRVWFSVVKQSPLAESIALINELERYTIAHFAAEETLMRVSAYPAFDKHKAEHVSFVARVQAERQAIESGSKGISLDLMRFLKDWLIDHILNSDKHYGEFYAKTKSKESGFKGLLRRIFG